MRTNQLHQTIISEDDMINVLYSGQELSHLVVDNDDWISQFKKTCDVFELPTKVVWELESELSEEDYIAQCLNDWSLPKEYELLDVAEYVKQQCNTREQYDRVIDELAQFEQRGMMHILLWLKYFVDTLRENNMVWGVGRGSSVSSYVLFLLDVHRVDSLKYELDIKEFLK